MNRRSDFFAVARLVICFLATFIVSGGGEMSGDLVDEDIFFLCGIFARSGDFPGVRVL